MLTIYSGMCEGKEGKRDKTTKTFVAQAFQLKTKRESKGKFPLSLFPDIPHNSLFPSSFTHTTW